MARYDELCERYKKREYESVVDMVAAGISQADEFMLDMGFLDSFGDIAETLEQISLTLPFAIIAVTESGKVIMGKKDSKMGLRDAALRSVKSGVAIAAGAGAALLGGPFAAIPTAVTARMVIDRYRSKALLGHRLDKRTQSMRFLNEKWNKRTLPPLPEAEPLFLPLEEPVLA